MGYTTDFEGRFKITPPLTNEHRRCLQDINDIPDEDQPGYYCQWVPDDKGEYLAWDGGEKFYDYIDWLVYLRDHLLRPWGYILDGEVFWCGEDPDDRGRIRVVNNTITVAHGRIQYEDQHVIP